MSEPRHLETDRHEGTGVRLSPRGRHSLVTCSFVFPNVIHYLLQNLGDVFTGHNNLSKMCGRLIGAPFHVRLVAAFGNDGFKVAISYPRCVDDSWELSSMCDIKNSAFTTLSWC
jgi:hypothetical protein